MLKRPSLLFACLCAFAITAFAITARAADGPCSWRDTTAEEQQLDAAAFEGFDKGIGERLADVQSVVVVLQGRIAYQYHRDGNAEALRDTQSVTKSALAALVGVALQQGHLASLDTPVLELVPEWKTKNPDPRAQGITVRHLLAMTAGFEVNDVAGTAPPLPPLQAWQRPMRSDPGQAFAYDNSVPLLITAVLEKATGRRVMDYANEQLVQPLGAAVPSQKHWLMHLRTVDMARLGQLFLQGGRWGDRALLPAGFAAEATRPHSAGGPPARLAYGLSWWLPSGNTYIASGYGGQLIWVHPPRNVVVAVTSTVSIDSHQRGQALQLVRERVFQSVLKRWRPGGCAP